MIVLDASAAAALLMNQPAAPSISRAAAGHGLAAPDHMGVEVLSVLRGWVRSSQIPESRARDALDDLEDLRIDWFPTRSLLRGGWKFRDNASAYDGIYLALAELLGEPGAGVFVLTLDERLARAFPDLTRLPEAPPA